MNVFTPALSGDTEQMKTKTIFENAREMLDHLPTNTTLLVDFKQGLVELNNDAYEWRGSIEELLVAALGARFHINGSNL